MDPKTFNVLYCILVVKKCRDVDACFMYDTLIYL